MADSNLLTGGPFTTLPVAKTEEYYVRDGGVFKKAQPNMLIGGAWQEVDLYVREGGVWKQVWEK